MIHGREKERVPVDQEMIYIKDASWPAPFRAGLEYNSPCHGPWNIVHIGMAVPESHQIYVCGSNCNRGVVLTAAEMQASDRYSTLTLFEDDLINGDMEALIIEGVTDILQKLSVRPAVVFLFTVCVHRFMGVDLDYIYSVLRERFPEVIFVESAMEPISQKGGLSPEQRLRDGMHSFLEKVNNNQNQVSIIGSDFKIEDSCEMKKMMKEMGFSVTESSDCKDFAQYLSMGNSSLLICCYPTALHAVKKLGKRLGTPYLYLPASFSYDEIDHQLFMLAQQLGGKLVLDTRHLRRSCDEALKNAKEFIGDIPIAIDASVVPRYLGLARLLLSHGFRVIRLYGGAFSPEEKDDYDWLVRHAPDLTLCSLTHPGMRVFPRGQEEKVLAVGQKAAYFHQTPFFVNMVQGAGLHGYDGIIRLAGLMVEALLEEKDTEDLVGRKGLGCESY